MGNEGIKASLKCGEEDLVIEKVNTVRGEFTPR
jgi:hypothetical protein